MFTKVVNRRIKFSQVFTKVVNRPVKFRRVFTKKIQTHFDSPAVNLPSLPDEKVKKRNLKSQRQLIFQQGNPDAKKESVLPGTRLESQLDLNVAQLVG